MWEFIAMTFYSDWAEKCAWFVKVHFVMFRHRLMGLTAEAALLFIWISMGLTNKTDDDSWLNTRLLEKRLSCMDPDVEQNFGYRFKHILLLLFFCCSIAVLSAVILLFFCLCAWFPIEISCWHLITHPSYHDFVLYFFGRYPAAGLEWACSRATLVRSWSTLLSISNVRGLTHILATLTPFSFCIPTVFLLSFGQTLPGSRTRQNGS